MNSPHKKKGNVLAIDQGMSSRSLSEPQIRKKMGKKLPLPSIALGDISKRYSKRRAKPDPTIEPWHTSTVVRHDYVAPLSSLSLSDGRLRRGALQKIEQPSFRLQGSELNDLPKTIFNMENLENLVLSPDDDACLTAKLQTLPKEVGNLFNLRQLVLDTNELEEIPEELSDLRHLDTLTLSNNHLATLPEGFSSLSNLKSLHLANNRFTSFPTEVCHLENLAVLDMSDNSIKEIPEEIYLLAQNLQMLFLYINDLEELPDCFCDLYELTTLWLGKNRLKNLPERFGDLENLDWAVCPSESNIDDNPLITPPLDVCRKGAEAIRQYFIDANQERNNGESR